ncbi:amidohydrolase family protein [Streptomyces kaempferi]
MRKDAAVPVIGVRHLAHIDPDPQWMMREEIGAGLTVLEREGLCFDLVVRTWQLPQATRLAARHGGLRFVLDHLGGPPEPGQDRSTWASRLRELARQPNVVAKVSGLTSGLAPGSWRTADLASPVTIALGSFGPERLLYGSDWPLAELGGGAQPWKSALEALLDGLSASERARVFGGNAADVYSLS